MWVEKNGNRIIYKTQMIQMVYRHIAYTLHTDP